MIKSNVEQVVELTVGGEIAHPEVPGYPAYSVGAGGKPFLPVGLGGVKTNVKVGDAAYGWSWGEAVAPGVSVGNCCEDASAALVSLACIGNEALVVDSAMEGKDVKVKGALGTVTGKHRASGQVSVHFPRKVLEKLCLGDRIQIRAAGSGLRLSDYPDVTLLNCGPKLLKALNPSEKGGRVRITVAKLLPGHLVQNACACGREFHGDLSLQGVSPEAHKEYSLDALRIGDLVAISDLDCTHGPRFQREAVTIGVVALGAGEPSRQGPGINVILTSPKGAIEPIITRKANVGELLGLS